MKIVKEKFFFLRFEKTESGELISNVNLDKRSNQLSLTVKGSLLKITVLFFK